ncbi:MAG: hypothetical protein KAI73_03665 [Rhodospirillaceae bacterium]|nr:hypothetical protein [Rhodospirillaceae bacterium]
MIIEMGKPVNLDTIYGEITTPSIAAKIAGIDDENGEGVIRLKVALTAQEETALQAVIDDHDHTVTAMLEDVITEKNAAAINEFKVRATAIHGIDPIHQFYEVTKAMGRMHKKIKGTSSQADDDALDALETAQDAVDSLRDKLDTLVDLIEAAADVATAQAIDPTNNSHWS